MSISKKLASVQIVIITVSIIISFYIFFGGGSIIFNSSITMSGSTFIRIYMINTYALPAAMFIIGVIQVVFASSNNDNSQRALGAGVLGILSFIPIVKIITLVANFFVIIDKS